jgi:hypothetical protein
LRIDCRSPGCGIGVSGTEIADSLRRIFEIFPFSGDWGRRPGSIWTAWPGLRCKLANFSGSAVGKLGIPSSHRAPTIAFAFLSRGFASKAIRRTKLRSGRHRALFELLDDLVANHLDSIAGNLRALTLMKPALWRIAPPAALTAIRAARVERLNG